MKDITQPESQAHRQVIFRPVRFDARVVWFPVSIALGVWLLVVSGPIDSFDIASWARMGLAGAREERVLFAGAAALGLVAVAGFGAAGGWLLLLLRTERRLQYIVRHSADQPMDDWARFSATLIVPTSNDEGGQRASLMLPDFSVTPLLARRRHYQWTMQTLLRDSGGSAPPGELARDRLVEFNQGYVDGIANRLVLAFTIATMMELLRAWLWIGFVACAALIGLGYTYPFTARDEFLLFSLTVAFVGTLLVGHALFSLERAPVISRLLCNTGSKVQLSGSLVLTLLAPVLGLIVAVAVLEIPGVMQLSGGLMGLLGKLLPF